MKKYTRKELEKMDDAELAKIKSAMCLEEWREETIEALLNYLNNEEKT